MKSAQKAQWELYRKDSRRECMQQATSHAPECNPNDLWKSNQYDEWFEWLGENNQRMILNGMRKGGTKIASQKSVDEVRSFINSFHPNDWSTDCTTK